MFAEVDPQVRTLSAKAMVDFMLYACFLGQSTPYLDRCKEDFVEGKDPRNILRASPGLEDLTRHLHF